MPESKPRTLADLVLHLEASFGHRERFFTIRRGGVLEAYSCAALLARVHHLALALEAEGVRKGERIAIFSENRPEWHLVDFACQLLGAVSVPVFPNLPADQISYIVANSGSHWIFYSNTEKREMLEDLSRWATASPILVAMDTDAQSAEGTTLEALLARGAELGADFSAATWRGRVDEEDLASILYTSGTTGNPKGVMLTHGNLTSNFLSASEIYPGSGGEAEQCVCFLPLSHVFARTTTHMFLYRGIAVHYVETVEALPEAFAEARPTVFASVPLIFERAHQRILEAVAEQPPARRKLFAWALDIGERYLAARQAGQGAGWLAAQRAVAKRLVYRRIHERFGGRLGLAVAGGAALPKRVEIFFHAVGIEVYQGYGLTETAPMLTINYPRRHRLGSVGPAGPGVSLAIAEDGEVLAQGPGIMRGYWKNEEATHEVIDDRGWFHTGDIGSLDDDGYLFITGRKKDILVTADGLNVAPVSIEQLLTAAATIAQAVVLGDDRPFLAALLVPDFQRLGFNVDPRRLVEDPQVRREIEEVVETVNRLLPRYEQVQRFALLTEAFTVENGELTPTLKVRRPIVMERYRETIDALYDGA